MPTARGTAKDPKDPKDFSDGASKSSTPADVAIDGPFDDGNGNFDDHADDGVDMGTMVADGVDMGTMVAVTTMDDPLAKMAAIQATVDLMQTNQARRDSEVRENQEKMNKNFETLMASLMPGTSDTLPPTTPTKRSPLDPDQQSPTGVDEAIDEDVDNDAMYTYRHPGEHGPGRLVGCPPGFGGTIRARTSRNCCLSRPCSAGCRACRPEEHVVHQGGPGWVPRSSFS